MGISPPLGLEIAYKFTMDRHDPRDEQDDEYSGPDWQLFGVLDLPVDPETDRLITAWLEKNLGPLQLHKAFLAKIIHSAGGAVARGINAPQRGRLNHVCLNIFIPQKRQVAGQPLPAAHTWGFFQTEKIESKLEAAAVQNPSVFDLMIGLYLYPEG